MPTPAPALSSQVFPHVIILDACKVNNSEWEGRQLAIKTGCCQEGFIDDYDYSACTSGILDY